MHCGDRMSFGLKIADANQTSVAIYRFSNNPVIF